MTVNQGMDETIKGGILEREAGREEGQERERKQMCGLRRSIHK